MDEKRPACPACGRETCWMGDPTHAKGDLLRREPVRGRTVEFRTTSDPNPFFEGWVSAYGPCRKPDDAYLGCVLLAQRKSFEELFEVVERYYRGPAQPSPYSDSSSGPPESRLL